MRMQAWSRYLRCAVVLYREAGQVWGSVVIEQVLVGSLGIYFKGMIYRDKYWYYLLAGSYTLIDTE